MGWACMSERLLCLRYAHLVIDLALLGVLQHVEGLVDLLELLWVTTLLSTESSER